MKRGQSAIEFTLITTVMLLLFATAFIVLEVRFLEVEQARMDSIAYEVLQTLEAEVQVAYEAGDGYNRQFFVPRTLSGLQYQIGFNDNVTEDGLDELKLVANNKEYLTFLEFDISGDLQQGYMNISGGTPVILTPS